jgi:glycosyltransferase involved in cell wall biosynthesis
MIRGLLLAAGRWYPRIRTRMDKLPTAGFAKTRHWEYASFNFLPNPSVKQAWKQLRPQILHLHWVGDGLLPLQYFPQFADLPTVVTMHGRWWFNGAQHLHSDRSARFVEGFLPGNRDAKDGGIDVDRWVWRRKQRYFASHPFEVIAFSQWMQRDAQRSSLLGNRRVHLVPNGLDLNRFHPQPREQARERFRVASG